MRLIWGLRGLEREGLGSDGRWRRSWREERLLGCQPSVLQNAMESYATQASEVVSVFFILIVAFTRGDIHDPLARLF